MMAFGIFGLLVAVIAACVATYYRQKAYKLEQSGMLLMSILLSEFRKNKTKKENEKN